MISYQSFKAVKYLNYTIDHEENKRLVDTFNEFSKIAKENKLRYLLGGSFSLTILSGLCFRTWKDIDIICINPVRDFLSVFLDLAPWLLRSYEGGPIPFASIQHYINSKHIDFMTDPPCVNGGHYRYIENKALFIVTPSYNFDWKTRRLEHAPHKVQDQHDIDFFRHLKDS